jgi:hypothetical protein
MTSLCAAAAQRRYSTLRQLLWNVRTRLESEQSVEQRAQRSWNDRVKDVLLQGLSREAAALTTEYGIGTELQQLDSAAEHSCPYTMAVAVAQVPPDSKGPLLRQLFKFLYGMEAKEVVADLNADPWCV